jgi:hypothetical protein
LRFPFQILHLPGHPVIGACSPPIAWGAALYATFHHTPPRPFQKLQVIGEAHPKHRVRASAFLDRIAWSEALYAIIRESA